MKEKKSQLSMQYYIKKSPIPPYVQLKNILLGKIVSGQLKNEMPSERELAEKYHVSRQTVRHALNELEQRGFIIKRQGRMSSIPLHSSIQIREYAQEVISFTEEMHRKGMIPSSKIIISQIIPANSVLMNKLGINEREEVVMIDRVRYGNNETINLALSYIPHQLCPGILQHDFSQESLYHVIETVYGLDLALAVRFFSAIMPTEEEARLLEIPITVPLLLMEGVTYLANGKPVEYFKLKFRGDKTQVMACVNRNTR